jgi:hypothetical protein
MTDRQDAISLRVLESGVVLSKVRSSCHKKDVAVSFRTFCTDWNFMCILTLIWHDFESFAVSFVMGLPLSLA